MADLFRNQAGSDNDAYVPCLHRLVLDPDFRLRFWSKVNKAGPGGCWLWTSNLVGQLDHGQFHIGRFGGKVYNEYAHRVAWTLAHGPIPDGMQVNHHCDVPQCVNPEHLYIGTQRDNMRDAVARHRFPLTRKPRKLSDQCVRAIRVLADGGVRQNLMAAAFNVTEATISQVVNGLRRIHIKG